MLRGSFDDAGIGLREGRFSGHRNAAVWVLELGCQGCSDEEFYERSVSSVQSGYGAGR